MKWRIKHVCRRNFERSSAQKVIGRLPNNIKDIAIDSRGVQPSTLFICIKGYTVDGHDFAQKAVDAGATIVVTERELDLKGILPRLLLTVQTGR